MSSEVSLEDLEWLAGEYGGLLSSVHGDRCISDGPEHCCTKDQERADGIFGAISSLLERAGVAEQALTDLRGKVSDEYEHAVTLCEKSPSIGAGRILTGLWRLHLAAGGASTTTPETEK